MEIKLISPQNKIITLKWQELNNICKNICEAYINQSEKNKQTFLEFSSKYDYFEPYYDFVITKLKYIQVGYPFFKNSFGYGNENEISFSIYRLEETDTLDYNQLIQKERFSLLTCFNGNEELLDRIKVPSGDIEGFILRDGSAITIKNLMNHQLLGYTYLLEKLIQEPKYLNDFLEYKNNIKDIREYLYYRMGLIYVTSQEVKFALYDQELITSEQEKFLPTIELDLILQEGILKEWHNPFAIEETKVLMGEDIKNTKSR